MGTEQTSREGRWRPQVLGRGRNGWASWLAGFAAMAGVLLMGGGAMGATYTQPLAGGPIAVGGTTEFPFEMPEDVFVGQVEFRLALEVGGDGFVDYLDVSLVSPMGTTVRLLASSMLGDEAGFLGGLELRDTVFSDAGTVAIEDGAEPYTGVFKVDDWTAATGLGLFGAERSGGTWRLRIRDEGFAGGKVFGTSNASAAGWATLGTALVITELPAEQRPPSMTASSDSGRLANDAITMNATPTFTGVAQPGSTVRLMRGTTSPVVVGTTTADGSGTWSISVPSNSPLMEGVHSVHAEVTRPGMGVVNTLPLAVTIDGTPPALTAVADIETDEDTASAPVLFVVSDNLSGAGALAVAASCDPPGLVSRVTAGGVGAARSILIQPAPGQKGAGVVAVVVTDVAGNTAQRTCALTVMDVNVPPVLGADTVTRVAGDRVAKVLAGVLMLNDTDADGDVLSVASVSQPLPAGAVVRLSGPFVVFSMPVGASGTGSFVYTVSDNLGGHVVSRVVNVVEGANAAGDDAAQPMSITLEGADKVLRWLGVPRRQYRVQYTTSSGPPHQWNDFSPVAMHVAARAGVPGLFTHRDVQPPEPVRLYRALPMGWDNEAPVAAADTIQRAAAQREVTVAASALLANDTDGDADALSLVWVGAAGPDGATVTMEGASVVYTAPASNEGPGSFEYEISDGPGGHLVRGIVTVQRVD